MPLSGACIFSRGRRAFGRQQGLAREFVGSCCERCAAARLSSDARAAQGHWRGLARRVCARLARRSVLFACPLFGGDTDRTPGPITVSIAMFGSVPEGTMVRRAGARPGDRVFVSGTIGDATLGLMVRKRQGLEIERARSASISLHAICCRSRETRWPKPCARMLRRRWISPMGWSGISPSLSRVRRGGRNSGVAYSALGCGQGRGRRRSRGARIAL